MSESRGFSACADDAHEWLALPERFAERYRATVLRRCARCHMVLGEADGLADGQYFTLVMYPYGVGERRTEPVWV